MRKLDLVAWLADGHLYHLELQSSNDAEMAKRMLDYYLLLWKRYGVVPVQHVIEEETVHMPVIIDPMENRVIKRYFLQGKEEGRVEGKQEGARTEAAGLLTRLLERRFGRLPKAQHSRSGHSGRLEPAFAGRRHSRRGSAIQLIFQPSVTCARRFATPAV